MELIKNKIKIDKCPKKISTRCLMEGDLIVPDVKPDAGDIIKYGVRGFLTDVSCSGDKISFKGKLKLSVLYDPKGDENKMEALRTELAINDFIVEDGLDGAKIMADGFEVTDSDVTVVNDRKMKYRINLNLNFLKTESEEVEIVSDVRDIPPDQIKKNSFKRSVETDMGQETFKVCEDFTLPGGRAEIYEICDTDIMVQGLDVKLSGDKIAVNGELVLHILYKPSEGEEAEVLEYEMPFNGGIETENKDKNAFCCLNINILDDSITIKEDEDGENRIISCETELQALYRVLGEEETEYLEDAYCAFKQTETKSETKQYNVFVCRNKNQFPVKETVELDESMPKILRIYNVYCSAVCDNVEELEDKAIVEGAVETKILYAGEDDEKPVCCYETMLPYRQTIELKGLVPGFGQNVETDLNIEHISWSMLDGREIEIKPVLSVCAEVSENKNIELISDLNFTELPQEVIDSIASMTLYVVKKGDTLWNIAKRYNTNIADIVEINHIENPDLIYPGDKLLIVKNVP